MHVPTTYLSAVDSAHGGKTALNVDSFKNQIGTFYPAEAILIVREFLNTQPAINLQSAFGEMIKMGLIAGGQLYRDLARAQRFDEKTFWSLLPMAVRAKERIVAQDRDEKKGLRAVLNLGHTFGHAIEVDQKWPHGLAVQAGLEFCIEFSQKRALLNSQARERVDELLAKNLNSVTPTPMARAKLSKYLLRDKKSLARERVRFVLLKKPGQVLVEELAVQDVVNFAVESGWAK